MSKSQDTSSPSGPSNHSAQESAQGSSAAAGLPVFKVLVMDADTSVSAACQELALSLHLSVRSVKTFAEAQAILARNPVDLMLLDLDLTGMRGLQQMAGLRSSHPEMAVVVITAAATVQAAVQAMRMGASDFLTAPVTLDELAQVLESASRRTSHEELATALHRNLTTSIGMGTLVGRSPAMEKVYRMISKVAFTTHPVLVLGKLGVGKELVARTIHNYGPHAGHPFVPIYCNGLSSEEMERELFGVAKGSLASGLPRQPGLLERADSGTIFLDDIDQLSLDLQSKLVRMLQERELKPVASSGTTPVHARIIASADPKVVEAQEKGEFRRDLFYRLNVVNIRVPSLQDRREDIPLLIDHILRRIRQETGVPYVLDSEVREMLRLHDWPGNVRELEGVLERACLMGSSPNVTASDLASQLQEHRYPQNDDPRHASAMPPRGPLIQKTSRVTSIAEMEKEAILSTLEYLKGDKLKAAKLLGIGKTTLYRKLKEYDLDVSDLA